MEKKIYINPDVRTVDYRPEYPVMSPVSSDGENANPYEEDW